MEYTINSKNINTDSRQTDANDLSQALFARSDLLFTITALSLLAGLIIPLSPQTQDLIWVLSLCLSGAIIFIALSARDMSELTAFPPVLIAATVLKIALNANCAGIIFTTRTTGSLIQTIGSIFSVENYQWIITLLPATAIAILIIVRQTTKKITNHSIEFATETLPLKKISVETDLNTGVINESEAQTLNTKIYKEMHFYYHMAGAARLLLSDAAIAAFVTLIIIFGQAAMVTIDSNSKPLYASIAAGAAVLTLAPAFLVTLTCAFLISKNRMSIIKQKEQTPPTQPLTVNIISQQTGQPEQVELLNPDFVEISSHRHAALKAPEILADFESNNTDIPVKQLPVTTENIQKTDTQSNSAEQFYAPIINNILNTSKDRKPILLAADNIQALPVTIAVNLAMRIAKNNYNCLLIDADPRRNAVAHVFDIDPANMQKRTVKTCIENLSIWTNKNLTRKGDTILKKILDMAFKKFEFVLLYAPNMNDHTICTVLTKIPSKTLLFGSDNQPLADIFKSSQCELMAAITNLPPKTSQN